MCEPPRLNDAARAEHSTGMMPLALLLTVAQVSPPAPGLGSGVAIGARAGGWTGDYSAPLVGGLLKLRPFGWLGVDLFADHTLARAGEAWRHDHVIGFGLLTPALLGGADGFVSPTLGACVDLRVDHPQSGGAPATSDLRFGVHGGLTGEYALGRGFSLQGTAELYAYLGHDGQLAAWSSQLSSDLSWTPVVQLSAGLNYNF